MVLGREGRETGHTGRTRLCVNKPLMGACLGGSITPGSVEVRPVRRPNKIRCIFFGFGEGGEREGRTGITRLRVNKPLIGACSGVLTTPKDIDRVTMILREKKISVRWEEEGG